MHRPLAPEHGCGDRFDIVRRRRPKTTREIAIEEWRGYEEPADTAEHLRSMDKVVQKALRSFGLQKRFNEEQVFEAWHAIVTRSGLASAARPVALENRVLFIQVLNSSVYYELERMKGTILKKMQERFGPQHIREVRFRLG